MQLAKDKVDRAIAGLDANWQAKREQVEPRGQSGAGKSDSKQDSPQPKRETASPGQVQYESGIADAQPDATTTEKGPASEAGQENTNSVKSP